MGHYKCIIINRQSIVLSKFYARISIPYTLIAKLGEGLLREGAASPLPTSWRVWRSAVSCPGWVRPDRKCILDELSAEKMRLVAANIL